MLSYYLRDKIWRMAACMVADDVAFYSPRDGVMNPKFCLLMNDTFAYASADAEPVDFFDIPEVYYLWKKDLNNGDKQYSELIKWVAKRRGEQPLPEYGIEVDLDG